MTHVDVYCAILDARSAARVVHRLTDLLFEVDEHKPVRISQEDANLLLHAAHAAVKAAQAALEAHGAAGAREG